MKNSIALSLSLALLGCQGAQIDSPTDSPTRSIESASPPGRIPLGGEIVRNARVRVLLLGNDVDFGPTMPTTPVLEANIADLVNQRAFYKPLGQYWGSNGAPGPGHLDYIKYIPVAFGQQYYKGTGCYGPPTRCAAGEADYMPVLRKVAAADPPDDNSIYMILVAGGVGINTAPSNDGSIAGGFHKSELLSNGTLIRWGIAFLDSVDTYGGTTLAHFSHELSEIITNPYPATPGKLEAWDPEIGDYCQALVRLASIDGIAVQQEYWNSNGGCGGYNPSAWPDFVGGNVVGDDGTLQQVKSFKQVAPNSSFVVVSNQYSTSKPAIGEPVLYAIDANQDIEYKAFDDTGDWAAWRHEAASGWVSKIAVTSGSQRSFYDVIGIGGDGAVYWRGSMSPGYDILGYWSRISSFTAADVAAVAGNGGVALYALGTDGQIRYQQVTGTTEPSDNWTVLGGLPGPATAFAAHALGVGGAVDVVAMVGNGFEPYISRSMLIRVLTNWHFAQEPFVSAGVPGPRVIPTDYRNLALGLTGSASSGGTRLAIAISTSNGVYLAMDNNSDWTKLATSWQGLGFASDVRELAMTNSGDGRLSVFGLDWQHHVQWQQQNTLADRDWGSVTSLGGWLSTVQAFTYPNGLMEVFGLDQTTHQIAHDFQVQSGTTVSWYY